MATVASIHTYRHLILERSQRNQIGADFTLTDSVLVFFTFFPKHDSVLVLLLVCYYFGQFPLNSSCTGAKCCAAFMLFIVQSVNGFYVFPVFVGTYACLQ